MSLIYVSAGITALFGFAPFAVDFSHVLLAKSRSQDAVDAASRYAAEGLNNNTRLSKAQSVAAQNVVDGDPLALLAADVQASTWNEATTAFTARARR